VNAYQRPRPLQRTDRVEEFESGVASLDRWLARYAWMAEAARSARTYVTCDGERIAGYYALATGEVQRAGGEGRLGRGLGAHPIPVLILARLAVDRRDQGLGLGAGLLRDAIARTVAVGDEVGVRALVVSAIDEAAASFYEHYGLQPLPGDPLRLFLLVKEMRRLLDH
jgi:GNAT superfamily N-acetyltransferase